MKILTVIFSLLISFLFLEIITRFFIDDGLNYEIEMMKYANTLKTISKNKKIGIEHKKNISSKLMGAEIFLNSNGFRNNYEIENDKKKILMLGDFMTFGWGAKKTFSELLENKIDNYQVLNAAIGNTNTIMQINNFFANFKDKYNYDLIVLNFFINDFEDVKIKKPNFIQKYSIFYTYFSSSLNIILTKYNLKNNWRTFYKKSFLNKKIEEETFFEILKLKEFCDKNNVKFLIHNIPELRNLKNYQFEKETNILKNFAKQNKIEVYDFIDILKKFNEGELWVTKKDPHLNDKAHSIIAEGLFPIIKQILNN